MTTYTTIPDSDIDANSPVTVALMTALRDNPIAITEGASGAPTISLNAFAGAATSGDYCGDVWPRFYPDPTTAGTVYTKSFEYLCKRAGTLNMVLQARYQGTTDTVYLRIYLNGTAAGTERSWSGTAGQEWEEDITVAVDDLVQIYTKCASGGADGLIAAQLLLCEADPPFGGVDFNYLNKP